MATIREIAESVGVSVSTVSRSLNGSPGIPEKTKQKVLNEAKRLGYRKDVRAASVRTGKSAVIGVVVGDIVNPFFAQLSAQIEQQARENGYQIMLGGSEDVAVQEELIATLLSNRVAGLLVTPAAYPSKNFLNLLTEAPTVLVDRVIPDLAIDVVDSDVSSAIDDLVAHIKFREFRKIVILSGPLATSTGATRKQILVEKLSAAGIDDIRAYTCAYSEKAGREIMRSALQDGCPELVICGASVIALGALLGLKETSTCCEKEVAIATFDRLTWLEAITPSITMIDTNIEEMAKLSVATLLGRIENPKQPTATLTTSAKLLIRDSTSK